MASSVSSCKNDLVESWRTREFITMFGSFELLRISDAKTSLIVGMSKISIFRKLSELFLNLKLSETCKKYLTFEL